MLERRSVLPRLRAASNDGKLQETLKEDKSVTETGSTSLNFVRDGGGVQGSNLNSFSISASFKRMWYLRLWSFVLCSSLE